MWRAKLLCVIPFQSHSSCQVLLQKRTFRGVKYQTERDLEGGIHWAVAETNRGHWRSLAPWCPKAPRSSFPLQCVHVRERDVKSAIHGVELLKRRATVTAFTMPPPPESIPQKYTCAVPPFEGLNHGCIKNYCPLRCGTPSMGCMNSIFDIGFAMP